MVCYQSLGPLTPFLSFIKMGGWGLVVVVGGWIGKEMYPAPPCLLSGQRGLSSSDEHSLLTLVKGGGGGGGIGDKSSNPQWSITAFPLIDLPIQPSLCPARSLHPPPWPSLSPVGLRSLIYLHLVHCLFMPRPPGRWYGRDAPDGWSP